MSALRPWLRQLRAAEFREVCEDVLEHGGPGMGWHGRRLVEPAGFDGEPLVTDQHIAEASGGTYSNVPTQVIDPAALTESFLEIRRMLREGTFPTFASFFAENGDLWPAPGPGSKGRP